MYFDQSQIESIAPKPAAFAAGKKLSNQGLWNEFGHSDRALWGIIKGSGKSPYFTQIDIKDLAYKCTCPSRQFPCKHGLGLLLLFSTLKEKSLDTEPEWVEDWIDKRKNKVAQKEEKKLTPQEEQKRDAAKEKRADNRIMLVDAGVEELQLWISDLIRNGLLELPNKPKAYFDTVAARMVDAKAPGLASWVRALGSIDYASSDDWFDEAISILARVNLLLKTWNNKNNLTDSWLQSIKNLIGWSQSPKELMTDNEAYIIKDHWIVLGQERETIEDLVIMRTWLWGIETSKSCLVLNFGTPFSPLENPFIVGTTLKSEVAFFAGHYLQRGIVRSTLETFNEIPTPPIFHANIVSFWSDFRNKEGNYPWLTNEVFLLQEVKLVAHEASWYITDIDQNSLPIITSFDDVANMKWILNTGNYPVDIAFVMKAKKALPLGIFINGTYQAL